MSESQDEHAFFEWLVVFDSSTTSEPEMNIPPLYDKPPPPRKRRKHRCDNSTQTDFRKKFTSTIKERRPPPPPPDNQSCIVVFISGIIVGIFLRKYIKKF